MYKVDHLLIFILPLLLLATSAYAQCPPAYTFTGEAAYDEFGGPVSGAGDVNNDGFDDLIVGAVFNDAGGDVAGRAYVYSGQDGLLLYTFTGEAAGDHFGQSVSGAGDVNNDGFDDLIVGAPSNDAVGDASGRAYVYSGQSGLPLYTFTGEARLDFFGESVSGAGDVNNDGFDDLIVGAPYNNAGGMDAGRAYVYLGNPFICADANGDSIVTVEDVKFLMTYYFECGTPPCPALTSDVNCDGSIDLGDVVYLSRYISGTGPPPCCAE